MNPFFILGPCVAESVELLDETARFIKRLQQKHPEITFFFKSSFDKANRTSIDGFRGPGLSKGLEMLSDIRSKYQLKILTDIHESYQAKEVAQVVDIIQIPAFLCRQTDLLVAAGETGKIVNIKKAQFISGKEMAWPIEKVRSTGNENILVTERGTMMGYNNLVVDFRNLVDMATFEVPVVFDATHSVQRPSMNNGSSGGESKYVPYLTKAAKAVGVDGYFLETHPEPEKALSDGANMLNHQELELLIEELLS